MIVVAYPLSMRLDKAWDKLTEKMKSEGISQIELDEKCVAAFELFVERFTPDDDADEFEFDNDDYEEDDEEDFDEEEYDEDE